MVNKSTYRISIEGYIDDQKINENFEFANTDKGAFLNHLRAAEGCVTFTDIHGHFFCVNFDKAKVVNLNVIEYVNG